MIELTEKQFKINTSEIGYIYIDNPKGEHMSWVELEKTLNRLYAQNKELFKENKELQHHIKKLEREVHFEHMRSMFSTVKSFKGDVSKRYYYSEETDRVYDSANNYGQYDKILDKKEIAMLLNEYETMLNGDVE